MIGSFILVMLSVILSLSSVQTWLAVFVTNRVNASYGTSIHIEKLDLSTIRNVSLKNVLIKDHHADTLIAVNELSTSILNYRHIFGGELNFGDIYLQKGVFVLKTYKDEKLNNLSVFVNKFQNDTIESSKTFKMSSSKISVNNVDFILFDKNKKEDAVVSYKEIQGDFEQFNIVGSNVSANARDIKVIENHDIAITGFSTNFSYSDTRMEFLESRLTTDGSELLADVVFNYNKGDLSDFTNKVEIEADFKQGDIVLSDLKKFYGQFGKHDKIHFSAKVNGTINDFVVEDIALESDRHSSLRGDVHLQNILDRDHFKLTGDIKEISSNYDHLINLLPDLLGAKIPKALEKIGYFSSSGKVAVTRSSVEIKLRTIAQMGMSDVDLNLKDIDKGDLASYKGKIELVDFKLGEFVKDTLIGDFSMVGEVEGQGFSIDKISIGVKGHISKHQYKGYTYTNIDINGVLRDKEFDGVLSVNDPNIKLEFKGLAELSEIKKFNFKADIAHADFVKLNLFTRDEKSILKGSIEMDLTGSSLDNIEGVLSFKDASYSNQNDDYYFKDFTITSENRDTIREVKVNSTDIVNGFIKGNFSYRQLKKLGMNSLGSLFMNYEKEKVTPGQFLDFRFNIHSKIVDVFFPDLILSPDSFIRGAIDSDEDIFNLTVKSPKIEAFDYVVDGINLQVDNKNPLFNTLLSIDEIDSKYYNLSEINLVNVMLNDTLFMRADMIGGREKKENYALSFYHTFNENNQSVWGMKKSEINFKENTWYINPENNDQNKVVYDKDIMTYAIDNFNMITGNQEVHLAGLITADQEKNIDLRLSNVNLEDITPSIDSVAIDGKVNGSINLRTINKKTLPIADLTINYFSINDDYYGDLNFKAASDQNIRNYTFDLTLINSDLKTFQSQGAIDLSGAEPTILASVNLDRFRINGFSPLGKNVLTNIRGYASGEAMLTGNLANPDIGGEITLVESGLELPYLNVNYDFDGESVVKLYDHTFNFQSFNVVDRAKKTRGIIDGTITHTEFKKWQLDLALTTNNLLVLNTEDKDGALYYGTGFLSGSTTLKGYTDDLEINVNGTTNPGTEFIVPLGNVSTVNSSKLIHFENFEPEEGEERKEIVFEKLKGLSLNFRLKVTRDALAQIVLDKATGSVLRGSGDGDLTLNIDTNGKFEMYGNLVVDNGEYQFKNIVNKNFEVQKGGTIVWDGNPYDAQVNITAINYTRANPSVLLDEIASSRKIDVELYTKITGNLSAPNFNFDVKIPNASSVVASELDFKLRNEDDKLTQFFSLLATGAFARTENKRTNFDGNAAIAGTLAQKASQLLSNMLESENENFEVGVTYDIGTDNSVQDVTTDDQLGLEVSGRIADKVVVSGKVGVPVGSNTNSNVIGEVEVKVPLNRTETFQAKFYNRQNEIQFDVIEGEGYTQGIGISYRFDFNDAEEFVEKLGLKKTDEEKEMTKGQRDSVRAVKKIVRQEEKEEKAGSPKLE
ncbi:translocation/assembly module TamB domain-containing protein [Lutimonas vermicola]|uniref:Translocation/assembly module TamB domain-containing protein n=1 Tax=Lutimonas vermicola TaxID=414288 RepID=A0ABU9KW26_9FLAO